MSKHTLNSVFWLIGFLLSHILAISSYAQESALVEIDTRIITNERSINLGKDLQYFEDKNDTYSLDQIMSLDGENWQKSLVSTPNFGYVGSSYWFRLSLQAFGQDLDKLLAIEYSLLDHLELYIIENGQLTKTFITGDTFAFQDRPIRHRDFLFPLELKKNQKLALYLKVRTEGSMQVPIALWERDQFIWHDQGEQFIKAMYYGMLLLLVVYNLFLFMSIRERSYLYYGGLVVSVLILMSGSHGFLYQYLYPNSPYIHKLSMLLAVPSVMLFASLFSSYFLSLAKAAPRLNTSLFIFNVIFCFSIVGAFFLPYEVSTRISVFLAIPCAFLIMFAGPYAWYKGQRSARYFTYAWAFLITGIIVSASSKFGFLPRNMFTEHALSLGSAIEALLLSFALADRFNTERQEKIKAQKAQLEEEGQRKTAEERLYKQATHESLDGLPNTVLFQQVLYHLLNEDKDQCTNFSLLYIHLDGIQDITKTLGHANADIVLSLFSKRLLNIKNCGQTALVIEATQQDDYYFAHIEKGLFAHVLPDIELNSAVEYAQNLINVISDPVEYKGMRLDLGVSIGIACFPMHGKDIATLTCHTRVAIDYADNSNNQVGVYSQDINPYSERRLVLMGELRKAIDNDSLSLHYQPIISCETGHMIGSEALLRWHHKSLGYIPPDEFISIAERTGMMRYLTRWVLQRALCDYAKHASVFDGCKVSVNISAVNLHEPDFEQTVISLLENNGVEPNKLVLEVTETSVMKHPEFAVSSLKRLASHSINLAIDDFGTGYSSLTYIQQLPLYAIKIDRSFIKNMHKNSGDQIIVKTTLNMSKDLGYRVVAEGVEDESALTILKSLKCDFAQGYYIAKPMPLNELVAWQGVLKSTLLNENL